MFYMLLSDPTEAGARGLNGNGDNYYYTKQGHMTVVDTLNDVEEMKNMIDAMEGLGAHL